MTQDTLHLSQGPSDFRLFLQEELVRRCRKNGSYSLRAFAKTLGISSSALSAIINGKRPLTEKTKVRLGTAMGLTLSQIKAFSGAKRSKRDKAEDQVQQITLDTFACISEWYHFAILELTRTKAFKPSVGSICRSLGLPRAEANAAVERLQRLGLLEIDEKGRWFDRSENGKLTNIHEGLTSQAAKLLQRQILEMAIKALNETPLDLRSNTAITVAIDPKDVPEAKKRIKAFQRDLANYFERRSAPTHVYQLAIALYPVTNFES